MRRLALIGAVLLGCLTSAQAGGDRVLELRLTMSGHVLAGVGVRQRLRGPNWADAGAYFGLADTWNFAFHLGLVRLFPLVSATDGALSLGYDQMFALDPGRGWRTLAFVRGTGGIYWTRHGWHLGPEVWGAYFLRERRLLPLGVGVVGGR